MNQSSKTSKKHFAPGYNDSGQVRASFKLSTTSLMESQRLNHHYHNATSAYLGTIKAHRYSRKVDSNRNSSCIDHMVSQVDNQSRSCKRSSPTKNRSKTDLLSHSVTHTRSRSIQKESSFDRLNNKTSATGFYSKPQTNISQTRLNENYNSVRVLLPQNTKSQITSIVKLTNPITGVGIKDNPPTGIHCNINKQKSNMDQIIFQNRDVYGRKQWC